MPLPGSRLFHPDWATRQRNVVNLGMDAACTIRGPSVPGEYDPDAGSTPDDPGPLRYRGPCSLYADTGAGETEAAGQQLTVQGYTVGVPLEDSTTVQLDDTVTIDDPGPHGDRRLEGAELTISGLPLYSHVWQRDLICVGQHGRGG